MGRDRDRIIIYEERSAGGRVIGFVVVFGVILGLVGWAVLNGLSAIGIDIVKDRAHPPAIVGFSEFASPNGAIHCQFVRTAARCVTVRPPRSVNLDESGIIHICSGARCIGHVKLEGVPKLAYGQIVAHRYYSCTSSPKGIRCLGYSGKGFRINRSGVRRAYRSHA